MWAIPHCIRKRFELTPGGVEGGRNYNVDEFGGCVGPTVVAAQTPQAPIGAL